AQLWCELLDVARVGRADHFFDLGGNSLIAIQLLGRIRVDMVVDISLRDLFDNPELQSLAAFIEAAQLQTFLGDELAAMEAELAGLSTEELDRLLTDESK
ncbi:hypothetical protein GW16_00010, partial [Xanthomonas arboricola pv. celebensis]|uniref:phosphopantetheine-binding protein n=1 Tax=Xanthomonas arboricola TaxID=56448 RepID=UPI0004D7DF70